MNRKGFTLIEILAIIVIMSIIAVIISPSVINSFNTSKNKSYELLIKNIKISGENYYQECENDDLSDTYKYGTLACSIDTSNNSTTITLGNLANLGILKTSKKENGHYIVSNPKTSDNINDCEIKIQKNVDSTYKKTTYTVSLNNANGVTGCPTTEELK